MGQTPRHQVSVRVQLLHLMVLLPARHCLAIAGDSMRRLHSRPLRARLCILFHPPATCGALTRQVQRRTTSGLNTQLNPSIHAQDVFFFSFLPQVHVAYDDEWQRRDVLGIHPQVGLCCYLRAWPLVQHWCNHGM